MKIIINTAKNALDEIRKKTIGVFIIGGIKEMIVGINEDDSIDTVFFTQWGAIHHSDGVSPHLGRVIMLPKGETLYSLLEKPSKYWAWSKKNGLNKIKE